MVDKDIKLEFGFLDLPVGSRFVYEDKILEVRKARCCDQCYFVNDYDKCIVNGLLCADQARKDYTDVIFVKIAEMNKKIEKP